MGSRRRPSVYTFKHALIREAAYESVLQRVRRQTHRRLVQVLEAQFAEMAATQPELLAHHALRGELWDKGVAYFTRPEPRRWPVRPIERR